MKQNGLVDVAARIHEYERLLESHNNRIAEAQAKMKEQQQIIAQTEADMADIRNIIAVCKKLMGEDGESISHPLVRKSRKLPDYIQEIVDASPQQDFTVSRVTDKLSEQGYPTRSKKFKNVVRSTMARMGSAGLILVREEGQNKIYWSRLREQEGGLLGSIERG